MSAPSTVAVLGIVGGGTHQGPVISNSGCAAWELPTEAPLISSTLSLQLAPTAPFLDFPTVQQDSLHNPPTEQSLTSEDISSLGDCHTLLSGETYLVEPTMATSSATTALDQTPSASSAVVPQNVDAQPSTSAQMPATSSVSVSSSSVFASGAQFTAPVQSGPPAKENVAEPSPAAIAASAADLSHLSPAEAAQHVTIWNREECRKIAGNAAPLRRNLARYLRRNPQCEEYNGQDKRMDKSLTIDPATGKKIESMNDHVPIWHKREQRKVTGNAAPLRKNLSIYLKKHPECEPYNGQDKLLTSAAGVLSMHGIAGMPIGHTSVTETSGAQSAWPQTSVTSNVGVSNDTFLQPIPPRGAQGVPVGATDSHANNALSPAERLQAQMAALGPGTASAVGAASGALSVSSGQPTDAGALLANIQSQHARVHARSDTGRAPSVYDPPFGPSPMVGLGGVNDNAGTAAETSGGMSHVTQFSSVLGNAIDTGHVGGLDVAPNASSQALSTGGIGVANMGEPGTGFCDFQSVPHANQHHHVNQRHAGEMSYQDFASSWSNMPAFQAQHEAMAMPIPPPRAGFAASSSQLGSMDRGDAIMGASMGTSIGACGAGTTPSELATFLNKELPLPGQTPPAHMEFSPSNFIAHGASPPNTHGQR